MLFIILNSNKTEHHILSLKYYQNILWRNTQLYTCIFEMLRASQKTEIALQLCITLVFTFIPIIKVANTY